VTGIFHLDGQLFVGFRNHQPAQSSSRARSLDHDGKLFYLFWNLPRLLQAEIFSDVRLGPDPNRSDAGAAHQARRFSGPVFQIRNVGESILKQSAVILIGEGRRIVGCDHRAGVEPQEVEQT